MSERQTSAVVAPQQAKEDLLPWQRSEIKAFDRNHKNLSAKEAEKLAKQFLETASEEDMAIAVLKHSNMLTVLKEAKIVDSKANGFSLEDVKRYTKEVDPKLSKVLFTGHDGKPVDGAIEYANGFRSKYDSDDLRIAIRLLAVGREVGSSGIVAEAFRQHASQMSMHASAIQVTAQPVVAEANVGTELEARLMGPASPEVAKAKDKILELPLSEFAAAYPSARAEIIQANDALKAIDESLAASRSAREESVTAEQQGKMASFVTMLSELRQSTHYNNPAVAGSALKKMIDAFSSELEQGTAVDLKAAYSELEQAFAESKKSIAIKAKRPGSDGKEVEVDVIKSGPMAELLKEFAKKYSEDEARGSALEAARIDADGAYARAQADAVAKIESVNGSLRQGLSSAAEVDAQNGDGALKASLDSMKIMTRVVDGKEVTAPIYKIYTKESAEFESNKNTIAYRAALVRIGSDVEADIAKLGDPLVTQMLAQAKEKESAFVEGRSADYFTNISKKQLDAHIDSLRKNGGLDRERETRIRQAAGYINFTYARAELKDETVTRGVSMTGAEAMMKAHLLTAKSTGSKDPEREIITGASVREYESLAIGKDRYRHEMASKGSGFGRNQYGAPVMTANYASALEKTGSALEAFDAAVSDNAGKALADYTDGMRRIQKNFRGFMHRNLNSRTLIQIGAFAAGYWASGVTIGARGAAGGGGGLVDGGGSEL